MRILQFSVLKRKIVLLWKSTGEKIIIHDTQSSDAFDNVFPSNERLLWLDIRSVIYFAPMFLAKAVVTCLLFYLNHRFNFFASEFSQKRLGFKVSFVSIIKRLPIISVILLIRPKVLVSFIDDSDHWRTLDLILHRKFTFITVQNGSRYFLKGKDVKRGFEHMSNDIAKVKFFSNAFFLAPADIEYHKLSGFEIINPMVIGSLKAEKYIKKKRSNLDQRSVFDLCKYDICLVLNTIHDRLTNVLLFRRLRDYLSYRSHNCSVIVVSKSINSKKGLPKWLSESDRVTFAPPPPDNPIGLTYSCNSKVTLGSFSTLLRETLGLNNRIYPINYDFPECDFFFSRFGKLNPDQEEFDRSLDHLLSISWSDYYSENKVAIEFVKSVNLLEDHLPKLKEFIRVAL